MAAFATAPVRLTVPATSANLGAGYDSLGLALDLRDTLEAEVTGQGLEVEVHGVGAGTLPRNERHLVIRSMRAAFDAMWVDPSGLRVTCRNQIPHGRGLGSSSAAIIGGLGLARALVDGGEDLLPDHALFDLAVAIEGHPDNVAPALFGGFVICGQDEDGGSYAVSSPVDTRIGVVALIPPESVSTKAARRLLPAEVPHADAAANAGRTALLVAALASAPEQLLRATRDYLHQEYRRPAMPASLALIDALRGDGIPAIVSGAGPTVLAFVGDPQGPLAAEVLSRCPEGWASAELALDTVGLQVG